MKYRLRPRAEADLEAIGDYIGKQNRRAALALIDAFEQRWRLLALYPHSGALRDDIGTDVRHVVVGEYLCFYRVGTEAVEILRVLHGRRNIERDDIEA